LIASLPIPDTTHDSIRRRVRLIVLIDAAENAGLGPIPILRLHALAYLANVLAPVWSMPALDGKVLKRRGGPFYPELQQDLDSLVGEGVATISGLTHIQDQDLRWRLEGAYALNRSFADRVLSALREFEDESVLVSFIQELALAFSALGDEELDSATQADATYSNPIIEMGAVVDFAEWRTTNLSAATANRFGSLVPSGAHAQPGERLHLYIRHLYARMHAKQSA
jgi:hypothetical protein